MGPAKSLTGEALERGGGKCSLPPPHNELAENARARSLAKRDMSDCWTGFQMPKIVDTKPCAVVKCNTIRWQALVRFGPSLGFLFLSFFLVKKAGGGGLESFSFSLF